MWSTILFFNVHITHFVFNSFLFGYLFFFSYFILYCVAVQSAPHDCIATTAKIHLYLYIYIQYPFKFTGIWFACICVCFFLEQTVFFYLMFASSVLSKATRLQLAFWMYMCVASYLTCRTCIILPLLSYKITVLSAFWTQFWNKCIGQSIQNWKKNVFLKIFSFQHSAR